MNQMKFFRLFSIFFGQWNKVEVVTDFWRPAPCCNSLSRMLASESRPLRINAAMG